MQITLQCFGAFRPFGETLTLSLPENAKTSDLRPALKAIIQGKEALIDSSRFATETEVLAESSALKDGTLLAIIPPVAGG